MIIDKPTRYRLFTSAAALAAAAIIVALLVSRKAYLDDFNAGVHHYLAADLSAAKERLNRALERRPGSSEVRELLVKVIVEESLRKFKAGAHGDALRSIHEAKALEPGDQSLMILNSLASRMSSPAGKAPQSVSALLKGLAGPPRAAKTGLEAQLLDVLRRFEDERGELVASWNRQQEILAASLRAERRELRGIVLFASAALGGLLLFVAGILVAAYRRVFGRNGVMAQLLELRSRLELPAPADMTNEFRKIDAIEAELVNDKKPGAAERLLQPYLEEEDPWVKARAAKAVHRFNANAALGELSSMIEHASQNARLAAIWALCELGTLESIGALSPALKSSDKPTQQAAIRGLMQAKSKSNADSGALKKIDALLAQLRADNDLVI